MVSADDNPERVATGHVRSTQNESEPPAATAEESAGATPVPTPGEPDTYVDQSPASDRVPNQADSSANAEVSSANQAVSSTDEAVSSAEPAGPVVRADEYPIRVAMAAIPAADRSPTVPLRPTAWPPANGAPSFLEPSRSTHRPRANEDVTNSTGSSSAATIPAVAAADGTGSVVRADEYPVLVARAAIQSAEHETGIAGIALANSPHRSRRGAFALAAGAAAAVVAIVAVGVSSRSAQSSVPGKSGSSVGAAIVASIGADGTTSRITVTAEMTSVGGQLVALVTAADGSTRELPVLTVVSPAASTPAGRGAGAAPGRWTPSGSATGRPAVPAGSSMVTVPKSSSSTSVRGVVPGRAGAEPATELQVLGTGSTARSTSTAVNTPAARATGTTDEPARTAGQAGTADDSTPAPTEQAATDQTETTGDPAPTTTEEFAPSTTEEIVTTADDPAKATTDQTDTGQAPGDDSATVIPGTSELSGYIPVPTANTGDQIGIGAGSTVASSAVGASASGNSGALTASGNSGALTASGNSGAVTVLSSTAPSP